MQTIRVLHIVLNVHEGGLERVIGDLVKGTDSGRFEIHVLALEFLGRLSRGLESSARLHVAAPMPFWSMLWPSALAQQIRRIAPAVVHTHSGVWFKASLAARRAGVPFVVHTDHGRQLPDPWSDRLLDGLGARRTDVVVTVSEVLAAQLSSTMMVDQARLRVIPNGIDTERFRPHADTGKIRRELGLPASVPIIGSIGRLDRIKGFDNMVEAFARLRAGWAGTSKPVLLIAGDGPERDSLTEMIAARGLRDSAYLLGWRDDILDLHSTFSLYTMSSRSEGTSIGLLEAMSAGLCPVVTDVGGNAAVLGPGLRHRLCAPEDPARLADAWAAALREPERARADGDAARSRVEAVFSVAGMVKAYEHLYEDGAARAPLSQSRTARVSYQTGVW